MCPWTVALSCPVALGCSVAQACLLALDEVNLTFKFNWNNMDAFISRCN